MPAPRSVDLMTADAVADFLGRRTSAGVPDVSSTSERDLVLRYREARRRQHEVTASNLAEVLLVCVQAYVEDPDFDPSWRSG